MAKILALLSACLLSIVFLHPVGIAQTEDATISLVRECGKALVPSVERLKSDQTLKIAFLSLVTENTYSEFKESAKASADGDLLGLISGSAEGDWSKFQANRRDYLSKQRLKLDSASSMSVVRRSMTPDSNKTFVDCVAAVTKIDGVFAWEDKVPSTNQVDVAIRFRFHSLPNDTRKFKVKITNGALVTGKPSYTWRGDGTGGVVVKRRQVNGKYLDVIVDIDDNKGVFARVVSVAIGPPDPPPPPFITHCASAVNMTDGVTDNEGKQVFCTKMKPGVAVQILLEGELTIKDIKNGMFQGSLYLWGSDKAGAKESGVLIDRIPAVSPSGHVSASIDSFASTGSATGSGGVAEAHWSIGRCFTGGPSASRCDFKGTIEILAKPPALVANPTQRRN